MSICSITKPVPSGAVREWIPRRSRRKFSCCPALPPSRKEGSIANSGRLQQWRYKAIPYYGDSKPDGDIMSELFFKVKELYTKQGGPLSQAITKMTWPYGKHVGNEFHYEPRTVAKEINGYFLEDKKIENPTKKGEFKDFKKGDLVPTFAWLQDDGSTSSGCWVYCGSVDKEKGILPMRRGQADPTGLGLYSEWAWCMAAESPHHLQRRFG